MHRSYGFKSSAGFKIGWVALTSVLLCSPGASLAADGRASPRADTGHSATQPPNILFIVLDDVGFGHLSPFGGPIDVPNIARIAQHGLRYNNFHTTALCSPTRAALLSGRNHHSMATGVITELQTNDPGYTGRLPKDKALFAESLRAHGYATMAVGKWHNTPVQDVTTHGPYDLWPINLGFDHFYGFLGADADQYHPVLWQDKQAIDPSVGRSNYHFTTDITDQSIAWLHNQDAKKPYFLYFAPGAAHAPHQVPASYIAKYQGRFDQGWDKVREETLARQLALGIVPAGTQLSPRPSVIPAWESLRPEERRVYARMQETYAGFVEHTDHELGRLLDALASRGDLEHTLIIITSDNGASGEGGDNGSLNEIGVFNGYHEPFTRIQQYLDVLGSEHAYNHYPAGWALAGNTPLTYWKQITHEGGVRDPLIIAWPEMIKDQGGIRSQFVHAIDVAPTIFELTGIAPASVIKGVEQKPIEGVSFAQTFSNAAAPTGKTMQYFEMLGNRGIWADGWKAVTFHGRLPWVTGVSNPDFANDRWELYKPDEDFAEVHDLARQYPQKLAELKSLWNEEALRYQVYPLNDSAAARVAALNAALTAGKSTFTYHVGDIRIPEPLSPPVKNRSHTITAIVDVPRTGAEGMLATCGGRFAGYAFYLQGGKLHYTYNYLDESHYEIVSTDALPPGRLELSMHYEKLPQGRGYVTLQVNGKKVGEGPIDRVVPGFFSPNETFDVGLDTGTPVIDSYAVPFRLNAKLISLVVTLDPGPGYLYESSLADPYDD